MKLREKAKKIYYFSGFWESFAYSLIFMVNLVYFVEQVGLNPLQMVLVGTSLEAAAFVFEIPTGVVADTYSRRLSVIIGTFLTGLAYLLEGSLPVFPAVIAAQVVWGLGYTFISGARSAWITDEVGVENVGAIYIRTSQIRQAASLLGIPAGVFLGQQSLNLPILLGGLLFLALGVILVFSMPEEGFQRVPPEERENWQRLKTTLKEGVSQVQHRPVLLYFLVIGLFVGLYSEGYDRLWTPHLLENFTFPTGFGLDTVAWFGVIRVGTQLLGISGNEILRRRLNLQDTRQAVRTLQVLYGLMIASLLLLAGANSFYLALAANWAFSVFRSLTFPISETWINQFIDSRVRATVLSVSSQVDALGQISGGPLLGVVGTVRSLRAAIGGASLFLLPVIPLFEKTLRREQAQAPIQEQTR
jgi:DHA3 family tetracycline resistance protein-like MFS transporter